MPATDTTETPTARPDLRLFASSASVMSIADLETLSAKLRDALIGSTHRAERDVLERKLGILDHAWGVGTPKVEIDGFMCTVVDRNDAHASVIVPAPACMQIDGYPFGFDPAALRGASRKRWTQLRGAVAAWVKGEGLRSADVYSPVIGTPGRSGRPDSLIETVAAA